MKNAAPREAYRLSLKKELKLKNPIFTIVTLLIVLCTISPAWCGEFSKENHPSISKSQENPDQNFEKMSKQMTPMFGNMVESMMQGKLRVFAQQDTTILLAKFVRNFYDALMDEGFSKEEALHIVTSFGFPAIQ